MSNNAWNRRLQLADRSPDPSPNAHRRHDRNDAPNSAHSSQQRRRSSSSSAAASSAPAERQAHLELAPMKRPQFGTFGRQLSLQTNFFKVKTTKKLMVHFYTVRITRDGEYCQGRSKEIDISTKNPVDVNRNILNCLNARKRLFRSKPTYDGRFLLYSAEDQSRHILGDEPYDIEVSEEGLDRTTANTQLKLILVHVYINYLELIDMSQLLRGEVGNVEGQRFLQCLDLIMGSAPRSNLSFVQVARSYYSNIHSSPLSRRDNCLSAWSGFYQSVRQTNRGLFLNVDFTCTAFWNGGGQPLMDMLEDFYPPLRRHGWGSGRGFESTIVKISKEFEGIKVKATHSAMLYTVYGFSRRGASHMTFNQDHRQVTIAEYFADQYNIVLEHLSWPCVKVHKKREVYIPIELLIVKPQQPYTGVLSGETQANMVRFATAEPRMVRNNVQNNVRSIGFAENEECRSFGLEASDKLMDLKGRLLPSPFIQYEAENDSKKAVSVRHGSWIPAINKRPLKFFKPAKIKEWGVINTSDMSSREVQNFVKLLMDALETAGISPGNPHVRACSEQNVGSKISEMCEEHRVSRTSPVHHMSLIVVIKNRQDTKSYHAIKNAGDLGVGVATQVCLAKNIDGRARNIYKYISNLILKINAKLGGTNCYPVPYSTSHRNGVPDPTLIRRPHIVLGADVSHPTGEQPSVAALVGSIDPKVYQFAGAIRNQKRRQEIISEIGSMFSNVYRQWFEATGKRFHAEAIIMFRDGVSEGQFKEVMEKELQAIRETCLGIHPSFKPKITFVIITKRHHARFFAKDEKHGDRNGNILPGTVVDSDVTSKDLYDFYLNSHNSIRGTSKPSKYTVLLDENNIPVDVLQAYIFRLSHNYCRTNGSVSMVHSAFYAHHLASRGRLYLSKLQNDNGTSSNANRRGRGGPRSSAEHRGNEEDEPEIPESPLLHPVHRQRLFFV